MVKKTASKTSNPQSLRVLMVEDSEDDALLIIRELKKGGYNPVYERVETAAAMKKALSQNQWEIILCDYKLPKFDAPSAIAVLKETNIDIPLIIVSGTIGEETAVECMRLGSLDYVMKNSLSRLCPAIARELADAEIRRMQRQAESQRETSVAALHQSEEKYRTIIENIQDGYFEVDLAGNYTFFNEALCEIYGFTKEELMGRNNRQCADEENAKKIFRAFNEIYKTGISGRIFDYEIIRKDGTRRQGELSVSLKKDSAGKAVGFTGTARDVTERIQTEKALRESEEYFKEITENSSDIIIITDKKGDIKYCSLSAERFTGYKPEEIIGRNVVRFIHPDDAKRAADDFSKDILVKDASITNSFRIIHKNGSERYFGGLGKNLLDNPVVAGFIMNIRDITENVQTESQRKAALEELRQSEERYRELIENAGDIVFEADVTGHFTFVNPAALRITGYSKEELIGKHYRKLIHPDMVDEVIQLFVSQLENKVQNAYYEFRTLTKDGREVWFGQNTQLIVKNGHATGFQAVARDITERKQEEEKAIREKHFSDAVIDSLPGIFYLIDKKQKFARFNKNMADVTGYSAQELSLFNATSIIKIDDRKLIKSKIEEAFNNGSAVVEASILTKDGREIPYTFTAFRTEVAGDIFITGMGIDISERKKMEETLRQSEERYRTILDEMADAYFEVDLAGHYTFLNDTLCRALGDSREELIGKSFRNQLAKADYENVYGAFGNIYITGNPDKNITYKFTRKDGAARLAEMAGFPLKNSKGEIVGFRGVGRDITESRLAEELQRENEEKYRLIFENSPLGLLYFDQNGVIVACNDSFIKIIGSSREALVGLNMLNLPDKDIASAVQQAINGSNGLYEGFYSSVTAKKVTPIKATFAPMIIKREGIFGGVGIIEDISDRMQAEKQRLHSFEVMRKALRATVQAISMTVEMKDPYTAGHQQRVSDLARSIATEMGLPSDELEFIRTASSIHDIGKIAIPAEILSKPTKLSDIEFSIIKTHSQSGYDILKDIEFPWPVADVVLQHHERINGSGYPNGLKGENILLEARILAVADVVEAIASHRPYRASLGIDFALEDISRNKGILYDADAVDACLRLFNEKEYKFH